MTLLVSAKGSDISVWRATGEFAATFHQALLDRLEQCRSDESERLLTQTATALEELAAANDAFCRECEQLIADVSSCSEPVQLRELTSRFYAVLYNHVGIHHSAPAFHQGSAEFLQALAGAVWRYAENNLGNDLQRIRKPGLIALGSAGRLEFTPFHRLQFMLVHGDDDGSGAEILPELGRLLHEGFEASGLQIDGTITPRNPQWRGSIPEWRQRILATLNKGKQQELIDILRLADQSTLLGSDGVDTEFSQLCKGILQESRPTMAMYVTRVMGFPHGIGLMGGFRLKKNGPYRGMFAVQENGMQTLSTAVSAFALLKGLSAESTPQRIREILWKREMNVEMAERLLLAWHHMNELCLTGESGVHPDWSNAAPHHLEPDLLNEAEREILRGSIETVASAQRYVGQIFSGMEE